MAERYGPTEIEIRKIERKIDDFIRTAQISDAKIQKDIEFLSQKVVTLTDDLDKKFVTRIEFEPIKNLVYGMVGVTMTAALVAVLAVVIKM